MKHVSIGEFVERVQTWSPQKEGGSSSFQYIDIGAVSQIEKTITEVPTVRASEAPSRARQIVRAGDILVSTVRPNLNAVAVVPDDLDGATASTGFTVLRPNERKLSGSFLFHWVRSPAFIAEMTKLATGQSYPAVSDKIVKTSKILFLPLDQQKRIAGILDQADALRRFRTSALDKLNTLGQAVFHETFGDPASNPKGWPMGVIGDLLKEAKYGSSGKANSEGRGLPMLRMGNVTYDGRIDLSDLKHVELSDKEFDKYTTRPGDLLFNRTNSKELVGKTAVVTRTEPMAIAGYLVRGRANARGNTHYISGYLNSTHGKTVLRNMCKNIVGMANINATEFQSIPIAIPPVELQRSYAEKLGALRAEEAQFQASLGIASTLFSSLQHRAFRGEL
ncbi:MULTISPECIES: restriction endonuclease subunit S [Alphaproteobacteria]|uniref:Type-1 restriction enzyme EcoKI specificity protein n=2 Tax=Alphaproteobacteria TaxID=28211 RepID=A0A3P5WWC3_9RHOB|nr:MULTISPECIES: restriction endonuclease subunit S [Alphaproteobacteria]KAB2792193.1 hypothetical protein F9L06_21670 [Brucella anthropi]VDC19231.1 Type-1 restriction enzyme EcoKI specificity protein [Pseudogemmobacter humi]